MTNEQIKQIIENYSGVYVEHLEIAFSPYNDRILAVRAFMDERFLFFMFNGIPSVENIQEIDFDSWADMLDECDKCVCCRDLIENSDEYISLMVS